MATIDTRCRERRATLAGFFALEDVDFLFAAERAAFPLRFAFFADLRAPAFLAAPPRLVLPPVVRRFVFLAAMANYPCIRELELRDEVQEAGTAVADRYESVPQPVGDRRGHGRLLTVWPLGLVRVVPKNRRQSLRGIFGSYDNR